MKSKNILLTICLMLLLATPVMAQNPNVATFASAGMAIDVDGNTTDVECFGVATFVSPRTYLLAEAAGSKTIGIGSGLQDYGVGGSAGYILNNYLTLSGGVWLSKTETGDAAPWYTKAGGALTFFPKADLLNLDGEKWGLTAGVQYTTGTKQLIFLAMFTTLFGT